MRFCITQVRIEFISPMLYGEYFKSNKVLDRTMLHPYIVCYFQSVDSEGSFQLSPRVTIFDRRNSKFCPRYTFRTCGSLASSSAVPSLNSLPSTIRYARSV